ncbi:hypothetical protein PR002_g910 [Phytophthora rubi]|uniref:Poly [ADP-ribose] polymerase n=1 Tax=Phytophthora rubi TaxID=129364 RepID=A0A6A3NY64_9STRA|nr:hypothetical protein PR002_g910 [Phytophthora rubi]
MAVTGKRKWQEDDWDVVMAAQSFVAVLAAHEPPAPAPAPKRGKKKAPPSKKKPPTRRSPRARKTKKQEEEEKNENKKEEKDADVDMAPAPDEFWLAQLQDDVTEDMLAHPEDVSVHVTWLNRTAERRYERAYDEQVEVGSILCHVFLRELSASALELTPKSLARVQRGLLRAKAALDGQPLPDDEELDNERAPPPLVSARKRRAADEAGGKTPKTKNKTQKLSKKEAAMLIPPLRATVDETKYEDRELLGTQQLETFSGDVASANREVLRAVLTGNVELLKQLTTKPEVFAELSTFDAAISADVRKTALHCAIDKDDLVAAALLRQTDEKVDRQQLAAAPEMALPAHSTGQHTSRFSDYNRRAINASRGGKEGNNALLEDAADTSGAILSLDYLWRSPNASVEMLTLLYPTGDWTNGYAVGNNVCHAARCGNYRLVRKVVETLEKNGGWGFNELHHKVLADGPDGDDGAPLLPPFRSVSAIKQANQTRLRPLHLAAINPNTKYLEALWAVVGDEFSAIKDDLGYEPIHYAAGCESPAPIQFLLERRCSLFGRTKTRLTPLMCALEAGREDTAIALLKFAATPGESGGGGQEVADKLVREKGPGGKQAVHFAARHGGAKVLEFLLTECGGAVEVNAVSGGTSKATPLTLAAQNGHLECVRILLTHGARVDLGDKLKKTPLILAVKNGHTRVAAVLINGGANVNAYDTSENSVAHYAASYGWPSCLQLLCDAGVELWSPNAWGFVPLACALLKQRRACAELILSQVNDEAQQEFLNFRDRQGRTMLFLQCQHSHSLGQLQYLLEKGLNPNIRDSDGEYPLQRLIKRACDEAPTTADGSVSNQQHSFFVDAVGLLLEHDAHPQYELCTGDAKKEEKLDSILLQPLQLAMNGNQRKIVELLLHQHGVNSDAQASDGSDAWMSAAALGADLGGDSFLSMLLEHHDKTANGEPLKLAGRSRPNNENFFHVVANHDATQLAAKPDLIRQCAAKCATTSDMMCEKDVDGYTPVMRLLDPSHERSTSSTARQTDPDRLQQMCDIDTRLTELLAIYAEKTIKREAYVRFVARHSIPAKEAHAGEVGYSTVTITQSFPAGRPIPTNSNPFSVTISSESSHRPGQSDVVEPAILVALKDSSAQQAVIVGDTKNRSPVHYAARNRDLELLQELLRAAGKDGARDAVNQRDWLGRTPLHYAVNTAAMSADASFAVERFLLQSGADASIQDDFGFGALHFALIKVQLDWQEKYDATHKKTQGQKDREGQIRDAEMYETEKREAFLREHLAVIPGGETDPVETVSNLAAERGLNLMMQDALGRSPLHLSAATGAFVCVSTLLASCGDSTKQKDAMALKDHDGFTPLGLAVLHKRQTTIMTLLRSGSAVDGRLRITVSGSQTQGAVQSKPKREVKVKTRSYFYHAVSNNLTGICHMLLSAKFCRRQAIEDSVRCGQFQLANNLLGVLESGSDGGLELLKRSNSNGETLLHSLAKTRQTGFDALAKTLAWALVDAGVRVDAQDKKGNTALHYAAKRGNTHLLDFLHHQSGGAKSENTKNHAGEAPLLFSLKQKSNRDSLSDNQLLTMMCYFLEHPSYSLEVHEADDSGMNVLGAFVDRFTESLAASNPVLFFTMLETLLKRGVDPNLSFQSAHAASLERRKRPSEDDDKDQLLRSGRDLFEITSLSEGDSDKMPALVRVALTPDASTRFHAIGLLLRYGAKLSTADGRGNTLLMHLAARNLVAETRLALGLIRSIPEPRDVFTFAASNRVCSLHVPEASVKEALGQRNAAGLSACHMAVQPLDYGSYENTRLLAMLVRAGGDLRVRDASGKSVIDYARDQSSRFVLRFIERTFPDCLSTQDVPSESSTVFAAAPSYSDDASVYLEECETSGKITRSRVGPKVNASCDVGKVSKVHHDSEGADLDALLTKVDVKNGRFGLNVFYRLQLVRDELQDIYVLFTNWGRIGETGKFQNTPFRDEAEAVNEFKKIFRSKTGNTWESCAADEFVKKPKKYNLVKRVDYTTKVDDEVTRSFREDIDGGASKGVVFPEPRDPDLAGSSNILAMLAAITDVHNLQLAAQANCGFAGGDLPLAKQDELRLALEKLHEIRDLLEEKEELIKEIGTASGDLSDEGATKRALLATRHEALIEKVSERSSRYYEIMPCQEDMLATSIKAFDQVSDVNGEITRLRLLSDIMETYKMLLGAKREQQTKNPLEYCYHALQVRLAPLQPADAERQLIHRYFFSGLRSFDRQRYRISNVFEVERRGETQRFNDLMEERPDLKAMQTHLLWHGTKRTNLMGILSQGLRVAPPEAPHHGYAYGKGLYFANVAAKSLDYCDAPYALPILDKDGKPDTTTTKTREVHYMLLCEVSLGKPVELTTTAIWGSDPLPREGMDSVKALAMHNPDPVGELVSPKCGAKLHLGKVKQVGRELPFDRVWAKTEPNPAPTGWYERNPKFTPETQDYLAKLLEDKSFVVGDTHTVSTTGNAREHFVQYQYDQRTVVIELVNREVPDTADDDDEADTRNADPQKAGSGAWCEATLKVTIRPDDGTAYSYFAKLYRNTLTSSPLAEGYTLVEPALSNYAELVVYKEAQARIRYVVEVETV